ncbi:MULTISPECIES: GerMN domain-containing protein [Streptomyces]|uniref:GerMN domain-containing protein n=1 Tax=Streptomyces TaxID=1883 RepID=UPI0036779172
MTGRRTRTRSRAAAATAALVSCALLLTGCGIKRTGVIDSGHSATVKVADGKKNTYVYFLSKEGDRLVPAPFSLLAGYDLNPVVLLRLLLEGPRGRADEAGLTTGLPQLPASQGTEKLAVSPYSHEGITVRVPFAVGSLSALARMQLVCTIGVSAVKDTLSPVTLQGGDTTLAPAECDLKR